MELIDEIELFKDEIIDEYTESDSIKSETGKIYVSWDEMMECTMLAPDYFWRSCIRLSGWKYKYMKIYFKNGYVWETKISKNLEDKQKIYNKLKNYVESGYKDLPDNKSSLEKAAELLDNNEFDDI